MRGLGGYFARAVVRRVAYVVVAAVCGLLLQLCSGNAHAAVDQGEAYFTCNARATQWYSDPSNVSSYPQRSASCVTDEPQGYLQYTCRWQSTTPGASGSGSCGSFPWDMGQTCDKRNASSPLGDRGATLGAPPSTCYGGCKVAGTPISGDAGGVKTYGMINRYYTGDVCKGSNDSNAPIDAKQEVQQETTEKPPECVGLGSGQTGCMKQNGDYCATASTGKTFCWKPSETGKKTDGDDSQGKTPKGDPVTPPPIPPPDGEWQRTDGHQQTTCVNNTCTTYNVTNYVKVPTGDSKNGTGDNSIDGSGNTSGNGSKPGTDKDGEEDSKDSATDSGNCTTPPICVGDTLKCLQLKFTWKIDCNTQASEVTKGDTCAEGDVPVCAGKSCKAEAYAGVLQQWKQRCAMEALGQGMASRAAGISNGDDAGVVEGIWGGQSGGTVLTLRQDLVNVGGGGNARLLPDVEIEGHAWTVPQGFYDAILAVKMVIIAMCTVIAMFVVGRNI